MPRLQFCTDEHVPHSFATALASNGFDVVDAVDERGTATVDERLLEWCQTERLVLVTNDRDFAEVTRTTEHAGVVLYTTQTLDAATFVRGIRRIDRQFTPRSIRGELLWLQQWL